MANLIVYLNVVDKNIDVSADFWCFLVVLWEQLEVFGICKSLFATYSFISLSYVSCNSFPWKGVVHAPLRESFSMIHLEDVVTPSVTGWAWNLKPELILRFMCLQKTEQILGSNKLLASIKNITVNKSWTSFNAWIYDIGK